MLEFASIGVAMGNAVHEVKKHANFVTDSVESDGVVNALIHFGVINCV
jgi:hydroxymethylpyrimidine pyrophosphatase-like HAD family hydrolase